MTMGLLWLFSCLSEAKIFTECTETLNVLALKEYKFWTELMFVYTFPKCYYSVKWWALGSPITDV